MGELTSWLKQNRSLLQPTRVHAASAVRHMNKIERKRLFSPEIEQMRTAEGRWYEAIAYEMFAELTARTDVIKYMALKGADAPCGRKNIQLGQNGLYYSRCGDITIRGNGQDLAEFDLLMVDGQDRVAFAEVVTSASDMKEFEKEIEYKKRLLGYLFDQQSVPFMLVSSFDVSNYSVGKRLMKAPDNINIKTAPCEEIKGLLRRDDARRMPARSPETHAKMISATSIRVKRPFNYQIYHDWERNRVFKHVAEEVDVKATKTPEETSRLVKKILYGGLYPSAIRSLCQDRALSIKGRPLDFDILMSQYSKVILATDLPDYEPLVYLRSRQKREYLKMVQDKEGNFKFERKTPSRVGFFLWLESISPSLGARITGKILDAFSPR